MTPAAIGYLRSDISGQRQQWDEIQIRSLAARLGYTLSKTVVLGLYTDRHMQCLIDAVQSREAHAVIVPSIDHLGGQVPEALMAVADVATVSPEYVYPRWAAAAKASGRGTE